MKGRQFSTVRAAAKEAHRLLRGTQDRRCASGPVWIVDEGGNGNTYWADGSVA